MATRRKILASVGGLIIGSSAWYKRDTITTGGLQITGSKSNSTTLGGIVIDVTVQNLNPVSPSSGKIVARVIYDDGSAVQEIKQINSIQPLSSSEYSVQINPNIEQRLQNSNYEYEIRLE
jgi:hypothetical protein